MLLFELFPLGLALGCQLFSFFPRQALPGSTFSLHDPHGRPKIHLVNCEGWVDAQGGTEILHEIAHKHRVLHVGGPLLFGPGECHLFLGR